MVEERIKILKDKLNAEFYKMNDCWLIECVNYFLDQQSNSTNEEILELVKSQWLLSDLREINNENGCLPNNLNEKKCTILNGTYILQMNKICDIAVSKYKQLETIRKISTENITATETNKAEAWEPKKKSLYQLYLTDGIQNVTAIEYKPTISAISSLLPGYKILIKGPIRCRRGVILLEPYKFQEIGGEVENLLIPNATENFLARSLNLPLNNDPYNDNALSEINNAVVKKNNDTFFDDEFDFDPEVMTTVEKNINQVHDEIKQDFSQKPINTNVTPQENSTQKPTSSSNIIPMESIEISDNNFDLEDIDMNFDGESSFKQQSGNSKNILSNKNKSNFNLERKVTEEPKNTNKKRKTAAVTNNANILDYLKRGVSTENSVIRNKRPADLVASPPKLPPKVRCLENNHKNEIDDVRKKLSISKSMPKSETSTSSTKICEFICNIDKNTKTEKLTIIRGKIVHLEKLSKNNNCWQLEATVTDGTGNLDVAFSSEILTKIIGYSVDEFSQRKKLKKANPEVEKELRMKLNSAQGLLEKLDALLHLKMTQSEKPKIIKIVDLTEDQKTDLREELKRIKLSN